MIILRQSTKHAYFGVGGAVPPYENFTGVEQTWKMS